MRMRMLTIEPGGHIGIHSHKDRPAVAYFLQGIGADDFEFDFGDKGVDVPARDARGHTCARCKRRVTIYDGRPFHVHAAGGWVS